MDKAKVTPSSALSTNANGIPLFSSNGKFNLPALRTNTTLRNDEWKALDEELVNVATRNLVGIADLNAGGLVVNLGGIGVMSSEYERASDMTEASVDMSGTAETNEDTVVFDLVAVPVPVVHKDFRILARMLEASRTRGDGLDVTNQGVATRKVAEKLEEILFSGAAGIVINGAGVTGYLNHANRNPYSGSDWGTVANVYIDCEGMVSAAEADNFRGPYNLYVSQTQYGQMRGDLGDGSGQTALQRVLQNLPQIQKVSPLNSTIIPAGEAVLVQMTRDVVDLAKSLDPTNIEWETKGGLELRFKVWAIQVPRVKADKTGASGVVHATGI